MKSHSRPISLHADFSLAGLIFIPEMVCFARHSIRLTLLNSNYTTVMASEFRHVGVQIYRNNTTVWKHPSYGVCFLDVL